MPPADRATSLRASHGRRWHRGERARGRRRAAAVHHPSGHSGAAAAVEDHPAHARRDELQGQEEGPVRALSLRRRRERAGR